MTGGRRWPARTRAFPEERLVKPRTRRLRGNVADVADAPVRGHVRATFDAATIFLLGGPRHPLHPSHPSSHADTAAGINERHSLPDLSGRECLSLNTDRSWRETRAKYENRRGGRGLQAAADSGGSGTHAHQPDPDTVGPAKWEGLASSTRGWPGTWPAPPPAPGPPTTAARRVATAPDGVAPREPART